MARYFNKKLNRMLPQWPSAVLEMAKKNDPMPSWRRRRRAGEEEELVKKEEQRQKKRIREEVLIKKVEATTNWAAKAGGKKHNT